MVFLREFVEKDDFEKSAADKKHEKLEKVPREAYFTPGRLSYSSPRNSKDVLDLEL